MATSGTVSQTLFPIRRIIDHACRRGLNISAERIGSEMLSIAQGCLFTLTSQWAAAGFPLWTQEFFLQSGQIGGADIVCPDGTVDILHAYWRILLPYRGPATDTNGVSVSDLFGGQPSADITITGPNAGVLVNFGTPTTLDTIGVLVGGSTDEIIALEVQTSDDGVTYVTRALASAAYTAGTWTYFNLDPTISGQYIRIVRPASGNWLLNQLNFGIAQSNDILIGPLNIDDYYNLPNKSFQGNQIVSGYTVRNVAAPTLKLWPTFSTEAFYNGCVAMLARRYIQDPGTLVDNLEIPQRWFEAVIWRLAFLMGAETPDSLIEAVMGRPVDPQAKELRLTRADNQATKAEAIAWAEERTVGPIRIAPNIRGYTA